MRCAALCVGILLGVFLPTWSWLGLTCLGGLALVLAWQFTVCRCLVYVGLGLVYALCHIEWALQQQVPLQGIDTKADVLVLDVVSDAERGQRFLAQVTLDGGRQYRVHAYDAHQQFWQVGQVSRCDLRLRAHVGSVNAAGFHLEAWALAQGLDGSVNVGRHCQVIGVSQTQTFWAQGRQQAWARLQSLDSPHAQGKAMVAALTVGLQDALSDVTWQAMRQLGVVHLVSISGVHVTMLALWVAWLLGQVGKCVPWHLKTPMLWQCWGGLMVATVYALVAGFHIPTQRTVWMLWVFALALTFQWRLSLSQVWWRALTVVVLVQPMAFLSVGLWLSFGLVAIMIWAHTTWQTHSKWQRLWRVQWALMWSTLVLVGGYFHTIPLFSPVANMVFIPWFGWVLTPLALLASVLPWDAPLLAVVALAQYSIDACVWAASGAPTYVIAAQSTWVWALALVCAYACLLPKAMGMRGLCALGLLLWVFYRPPLLAHGQLRLQVLDVGQGLSVLLSTRQHQLLFDTGKSSAQAVVLPALYAQAWQNIDAVVLSHTDDDHDGAAAELFGQARAQTLWTSEPEHYPQWPSRACRGAAWQWDGVWFEWLTLPISPDKASPNATSCVLRVVTQGQAVLIPADIGHAQEALLLAHYGERLRSTVLLLGHHGSSNSSSSAWLNVVAPNLAIASSGWQNSYHHPTAKVQTRLQAHNIPLYRTDVQGGAVWLLDQDLIPQPFTGRRYWWQKKPF